MAGKIEQDKKNQFRWTAINEEKLYVDGIKVQVTTVINAYINLEDKWGVQSIKVISQCDNRKSEGWKYSLKPIDRKVHSYP